MTPPEVSIVVPAYNEADNLVPLHRRLTAALHDVEHYEVIYVDDGGSDGSIEALRLLAASDPHVGFISLSRNFGHQHALLAGLEAATGACVISLDADLQHPPELIPEMIARWHAGAEIVSMLRRDEATPVFKRATSRLFYRLVNAVSDIEIDPGSSDFRLLDRRVVDALGELDERTLFLRGVIPWLGFRRTTIDYVPEQRHAGTSKYTFRRMLSLALNGMMSSSVRPLALSTFCGAVMSALAVAYAAYALTVKLVLGTAVSGWASLLISVMLMGGVQLIMLGILGQYLGRVLVEVKGRPNYIVRESHASRLPVTGLVFGDGPSPYAEGGEGQAAGEPAAEEGALGAPETFDETGAADIEDWEGVRVVIQNVG